MIIIKFIAALIAFTIIYIGISGLSVKIFHSLSVTNLAIALAVTVGGITSYFIAPKPMSDVLLMSCIAIAVVCNALLFLLGPMVGLSYVGAHLFGCIGLCRFFRQMPTIDKGHSKRLDGRDQSFDE